MEYIWNKTRVLIFTEGTSQNTIPNNIFSCEVKIKTLSHKCFAYKKLFFSVNINMQGNKTGTDKRPVHYLGRWFQQKEELLHLGNNMIRKFGSLVVHH